jgi:hypothetical protein
LCRRTHPGIGLKKPEPLKSLGRELWIGVLGDVDQAGCRQLTFKLAPGCESVEHRHDDVHNRQIGRDPSSLFDEGAPVHDCANHVALHAYETSQGGEHRRMVVSDQHRGTTMRQRERRVGVGHWMRPFCKAYAEVMRNGVMPSGGSGQCSV